MSIRTPPQSRKTPFSGRQRLPFVRRFSALILTLALLAACVPDKSDRFETTPTMVEMAGHRFVVPRNYLLSKTDLDMRLLLPDFQPRTEQNEHMLNDPSARRKLDVKFIELAPEYSKPANSFDANNQKAQSRRLSQLLTRRLKGSSEGAYAEPVSLEDGFNYYASKESNGWADDLYVYRQDGNIVLLLECSSKTTKDSMPNPTCSARANVFGSIGMKYWYPIKYRSSALEIHNELRSLLTHFRKGFSL